MKPAAARRREQAGWRSVSREHGLLPPIRIGRSGEQQLRVGVRRLIGQLDARCRLDQLSRVHDRDRVRQVAGRRDVVRDIEDREALLVAKVGKQIEHAEADRHVEHRDRLIRDQDARPDGERASDGDPLPLPTRQLVRELGRELRRRLQSHAGEKAGHGRVDVVAGEMMDLERAGELVPDPVHRVQRSERILKDHLDGRGIGARAGRRRRAAVDEDAAPVRFDDLGEEPSDGCLAGPALAHQRSHLAAVEPHRHVVDRVHRRSAREEPATLLDRKVLHQVTAFQHGRANGRVHGSVTWLTVSCRVRDGSGRDSSAGTGAWSRCSQHATSRLDAPSCKSCGTSCLQRSIAHPHRG